MSKSEKSIEQILDELDILCQAEYDNEWAWQNNDFNDGVQWLQSKIHELFGIGEFPANDLPSLDPIREMLDELSKPETKEFIHFSLKTKRFGRIESKVKVHDLKEFLEQQLAKKVHEESPRKKSP